jgi:hypothetical protein
MSRPIHSYVVSLIDGGSNVVEADLVSWHGGFVIFDIKTEPVAAWSNRVVHSVKRLEDEGDE